jgi:hypothetical protein
MPKKTLARGFSSLFLVLVLPTTACSSDSNKTSNNGSATGGSSSTADAASDCMPAGTLTVTAEGSTAYMINGSANPTLHLCRGEMYTFQVNAPGHPFYVKTAPGTGTANAYSEGITNNGTDSGSIMLDVPMSAPNTLYYNCSVHAPMTGVIDIM